MTKQNLRYDYIDNTKGLALLLVISWHCYFDLFHHPVFSEWVLPFFFMVMGVFYKHNLTFKELIIKKTNGLLIPWLILSIPAVILAAVGVNGFELKRIYDPYLCVLGPSWFLICMFWCYLIFWGVNELIRKFVKTNINQWIVFCCCLLSALSWCGTNYFHIAGHRLLLPLFLSAALTCIVFVGAGYCFKNMLINDSPLSLKNIIIVALSITVMGALVYLGGGEPFNPMWNSTQQPIVLAILCALLGSFIANWACRIIPNVFKWIGGNTIPLLCIHYYPTQLLLFYTPNIEPWLRYLLVLIISLPISYFICKYFPVVNGKGSLIRFNYENN